MIDYVIGGISIVVGTMIFTLFGIQGRLELTRRSQRFEKMVGKNTARIIYSILGLTLLLFGINTFYPILF